MLLRDGLDLGTARTGTEDVAPAVLINPLTKWTPGILSILDGGLPVGGKIMSTPNAVPVIGSMRATPLDMQFL